MLPLAVAATLIFSVICSDAYGARRHHHRHHSTHHASPSKERDETPQENGGDFTESVQEMQSWLRQREAERHENWGSDLVTPEIEKPANRHYFEDQGLDEHGYRQLGDLRFRLRSLDGEDDRPPTYAPPRRHHRHFSRHETNATRLRRTNSHKAAASPSRHPGNSAQSSAKHGRSKHR